jgi:hypothetical protein
VRRLRAHLRVGDRVRVRPLQEILGTLDQDGCVDALPFMPEMAGRCGREFTVLKRVDKVNDLVDWTGLRRMTGAVILEGDRCDGSQHGGCQALCQSIWKEVWLTRIDERHVESPVGALEEHRAVPRCTEADLVRFCGMGPDEGGDRYRCQQTEMKRASTYLAWWDPRQYWRDWRSGNASALEMTRAVLFWMFKLFLQHVGGGRILLPLYNAFQRLRNGEPYPYRSGVLRQTPAETLDLVTGEWVRVKGFEEILATLNVRNKNRGLWFDAEMVKYCNGVYRVLARVKRIVDPKSGRILTFDNDCIILEGVTTRGDHHRFYPQNEYPFWREIWLKRVQRPTLDRPVAINEVLRTRERAEQQWQA